MLEHSDVVVRVLGIKFTELPGGVGAPEEAASRAFSLSDIVDSNGNKVVVFNS